MVGGVAVVGHQAALRSGHPAEVVALLSVGGVSARHWWRLAAVNSATVISGGCTHSCDQTHCARGTRRPWWWRPQTWRPVYFGLRRIARTTARVHTPSSPVSGSRGAV